MKIKKKAVIIIKYLLLLLCVAGFNIKYNFILIPTDEDMIQRQMDFITVSTVFAGFSFTALGMLLGLSSEKLIELIKNTNIIVNKADRIILSIAFFILSVVASLILVLGLDKSIIKNATMLNVLDNYIYILGIGFLIVGIVYFVYSVYELADLIKRVYSFNSQEINKKIERATSQMENIRKRMHVENGNGIESD